MVWGIPSPAASNGETTDSDAAMLRSFRMLRNKKFNARTAPPSDVAASWTGTQVVLRR
jgi:hypothetical protein